MIGCPHCDDSHFGDENALWQHARAKHSRAQAKALRPPRPEREQSMAELLAEAQIAHACGEPVDEWIAAMFPDSFS